MFYIAVALLPTIPVTLQQYLTILEKKKKKNLLGKVELSLPLKKGVCSSKHSINDVEVATSEAGHHLSEQVGPFLREIFSSYDTDGIT